jgi:hypothetical protein
MSDFETQMTEEHEEFLHFVTCVDRLNSAWITLRDIKTAGESLLVGPAFRFALVQYAMPYTRSDGTIKKGYKLTTTYVPSHLLDLHTRLLDSRNKMHAHADLTTMEAKLYLTETQGTPSIIISGNNIHGLEELCNIDEIISLIEGTLLNMYADQDIRIRALNP